MKQSKPPTSRKPSAVSVEEELAELLSDPTLKPSINFLGLREGAPARTFDRFSTRSAPVSGTDTVSDTATGPVSSPNSRIIFNRDSSTTPKTSVSQPDSSTSPRHFAGRTYPQPEPSSLPLTGPTVPDIETVPDTGPAPATEIVAGTESVPRSETIPSPPSVSDTDLISDTDQDYPRSPRYQKPKPRRARSVEDGHSHSEQSLYEALWERARHYNADCRVITMGFGSMSHIARLSLNNCRQNVRSLIRKLALEELCAEKCDEKIGKTYLIYNPQTILRRRKAAGLEWVIRTKGVVFIDVASGAILTDRTPDSSSTGSASASDSVSVPDTVSIGEEP